MKFTISKQSFIDALSQVLHVVTNRTMLPILSNVLIEAKGGRLKLITTDLDVGVVGTVEADISKEGVTTLPVKRLASIIRELPSEMVDFSVDSKNIATIKSGPAKFIIYGLGEDEFPTLPTFDEAKDFKISQLVLLEGLRKTSYAISSDETRYVLNGIYASFKEGKMSLVATDGRRLAMVDNDLEFPASNECDVIIPSKAINELQRLLKPEGDVHVRINDNHISFEINGSRLVSKLIEGNYPNYRQVIPSNTTERVEVDREAFLDTVRRVSILATDKSNSVKLSFGLNTVNVMANTPDVGEATEQVDVRYTGKEFAIAFNPEFLMAPLKNLTSETVYIDMIDEMSPGVVRIEGSFLYVIMPMRVTG